MARKKATKIQKRKLQDRRNKRSMQLIAFVVVIFAFTLGVSGATMYAKNTEYNELIHKLEQQLEEEEKRTQEISDFEEHTTTDAYIEEVAKEKLGMAYPDEIILKSKE